MKKALIFGVGGFVGAYLVQEFVEHGYEVHGTDMFDQVNIDGLVSYRKANLLEEDAVSQLIGDVGPTHIVNLAGMSSVGQSWNAPQLTMSVNVNGALNILEAVRKLELDCKVLFIGSSEEYVPSEEPMDESRPIAANNPYGISKVALEDFVKIYRHEYGIKVYLVRAFNHIGIGQRDSFVMPSWCRQVAEIAASKKNGEIHVGNLSVYRDFTDVRDVVRAYRMIIESDKQMETYNVGSGEAHSLRDILEYLIGLSGVSIDIIVDKDRIRPNENRMICCDHSKVTRELGWEPERDIFETIRKMYEYYLEKV